MNFSKKQFIFSMSNKIMFDIKTSDFDANYDTTNLAD